MEEMIIEITTKWVEEKKVLAFMERSIQTFDFIPKYLDDVVVVCIR